MSIQTKLTDNQVYVAKEETLILTVTVDGDASTVSGASSILYNSYGNEKATLTPQISGAGSNILTVTIPETIYTEIEQDCRIEWTFTVNTNENIVNNLFDVVNYKVFNPVITDDLKKMHPDLEDDLWSTQSTFQPQIDEAYSHLKTDIKNKGNRPALVVDMEQFEKCIKYKALSIIFWGQFREPGDRWAHLAEKRETDYETEFEKTTFKYDSTGSGDVDSKTTLGNIQMSR